VFHIVLFQPEIPPNTGNIIRLTANTGCKLHLIKPLGFELTDKHMRRAGLDYHEYAELQVHEDWEAAKAVLPPTRYAFTTKGSHPYHEAAFKPDDVFVFGPETRGLPLEILEEFQPENRLRLPMRDGQRSLNLSNAAAVVVFEAWRQNGFVGRV
jgi:tRNA (cytidine/uridine-2'-O-)-methyltransferase